MPNRAKTYARYLLMVINHSLNSAFKLSYQNVDSHNKSCDLASSTKIKKVVDVGVVWSIKYGRALVELRSVSKLLV